MHGAEEEKTTCRAEEQSSSHKPEDGCPLIESESQRLIKKAKLESTVVKIGGKKLRAGTVPWRWTDAKFSSIQVLLIEGLNTPGRWTFPAGSLDPGEQVPACAVRETMEECGASGSLGGFLGTFDTDKNRTYMFLLHVQHMEDESNEAWHDPHSAYETSGLRIRRWFHLDAARPLLKKDGPQILDAFLSVPEARRLDASYKPVGKPPKMRLLLLGGSDALRDRCCQWGCLHEASLNLSTPQNLTDHQLFAAVAAAFWEADVAVFCGGADILHMAGLSASQGLPTLVLVTGLTLLPRLLGADSRITSFMLRSKSILHTFN